MDYIDAETGENISLALETMIADLDGYDDLRTRSRLIPPDEVRELLQKADKALDTTLKAIAQHHLNNGVQPTQLETNEAGRLQFAPKD